MPKGENTKKVAGNAKVLTQVTSCDSTNRHVVQKAEVAAQKAAAENAKKAQAEAEEWSKGAKSNAKKFVQPTTSSHTYPPPNGESQG